MTNLIERIRANFPTDLLDKPNWVNWRYENDKNGKPTKVPYNARGYQKASSTNPATWSTFEQAAASYINNGRDGVSYAPCGDGVTIHDLDHSLGESGAVKSWARPIIVRFDSYTEVSPSGTGVHIYSRAHLSGKGRNRPYADGRIEIYDRAHFITVTGAHLEGAPHEIRDCQDELDTSLPEFFPEDDSPIIERAPHPLLSISDEELLTIMRNAKNGAAFSALFDRGDLSAYEGDHSRADFALCCHLAFWTGWDKPRMERLFTVSALNDRDKWDRADYRDRTIGRAISGTPVCYSGAKGKSDQRQTADGDDDQQTEEDTLGDDGDGATEGEWGEPTPLPDVRAPVDPFDYDLLPSPLRPWVKDTAERMCQPPDIMAVGVVGSLGEVIGRKAGIHPKRHDDWLVIPNLWGAAVAPPSKMKTPMLEEATKPLTRLAAEAMGAYLADMAAYEAEKEIHDAKVAGWKDAIRKAKASGDPAKLQEAESAKEPPLRDKPVKRRFKTNDATVEKIGEMLIENPNGLLVFRDELMGFLRSLEKVGREGDRQFYLEGWNGTGSYDVDRIGRGELHVPALCLSLLGGIQPGPLASYVYDASRDDGRGNDGFIQRFQLLVWPDFPTTWRNVDRYPDTQAKNTAYAVYEKLAALVPERYGARWADGETIPALRFDAEAQAAFDEWREDLELRLCSGDLHPALEAHLAKYRSLMPSLALIFHLVECVTNEHSTARAVTADSTRRAASWCDYLETHANRLYDSAVNPGALRARALLKHIQAGDIADETPLREIHRNQWANLRTAEEVNDAARVLSEHGWVKVAERKPKTGRASNVLLIHPALLAKKPPSEDEAA
jgi:hypothetical protein